MNYVLTLAVILLAFTGKAFSKENEINYSHYYSGKNWDFFVEDNKRSCAKSRRSDPWTQERKKTCFDLVIDIEKEKDGYDIYFTNESAFKKNEFEQKTGVQITSKNRSAEYFFTDDGKVCQQAKDRNIKCILSVPQKVIDVISENTEESEDLAAGFAYKFSGDMKVKLGIFKDQVSKKVSEAVKGMKSPKVQNIFITNNSPRCEDKKARSNIFGFLITIATSGYYNFDFSSTAATKCRKKFDVYINLIDSKKIFSFGKTVKLDLFHHLNLPFKDKKLKSLFYSVESEMEVVHEKSLAEVLCAKYKCNEFDLFDSESRQEEF